MDGPHTPDPAPAPAYDVLGRLGSWHSYRLLFFVGGLFVHLLMPWHAVERPDLALTVTVAVGVAWAVPCWLAGVTARRGGVHLNYGLVVRRIPWEQIVRATVAWRGVDPRLRIDLTDDREAWAPGFVIPLSQSSSREDGWRGTEMYRAAQLITAEAERRRRPPDDGVLDLAPAPTRVRPARALSPAA